MKMAREVGSSSKLVGCAAYLQANTSARCPAARPVDFRRQDVLVDAFKHRAKRSVLRCEVAEDEDLLQTYFLF